MIQDSHVSEIQDVTPSADGCEDCLRAGDSWVHLRLCMICGHVGCCDNSRNRHATKHFHSSDHAVIKSFEPGEEWGWCYVDDAFLEAEGWPVDGPRAHSAAANRHRAF